MPERGRDAQVQFSKRLREMLGSDTTQAPDTIGQNVVVSNPNDGNPRRRGSRKRARSALEISLRSTERGAQ